MNLFNELKVEDIVKIEDYINDYAHAGECEGEYSRVGDRAPLETILAPWSKAKQRLFKIFGGNLIIEKEISYNKPIANIERDLREILVYGNNIYNIRKVDVIANAKTFYHSLKSQLNLLLSCDLINDYTRDYLLWLDLIAQNEYNGDTFILNEVKFQKGMKITKIFERLASMYDIPYFEDFRLVHSMVLNNKKTKGTLCLSIHPLDYMTMSDNNNDWSSCMSWENYGCYRQGTVEMMNSPCVVVGYLKSEDTLWNGWNSKKWRQLFIVDDRIITGVKQYPNRNDAVSKICIDMLYELATSNGEMSFHNTPVEDIRTYEYVDFLDYTDVKFRFLTTFMYNDIEHAIDRLPYSYIGTCVEDNTVYEIIYSGASECMWCGNTNENALYAETLICSGCYDSRGRNYCYKCGDTIYDDDTYMLDGEYYCEYCYNEVVVTTIDDEYHARENTTKLYAMNPDTNEICPILSKETDECALVYSNWSNDTAEDHFKEYFDKIWSYTRIDSGKMNNFWSLCGSHKLYIDINSEGFKYFLNDYDLYVEEANKTPLNLASTYHMRWFDFN